MRMVFYYNNGDAKGIFDSVCVCVCVCVCDKKTMVVGEGQGHLSLPWVWPWPPLSFKCISIYLESSKFCEYFLCT